MSAGRPTRTGTVTVRYQLLADGIVVEGEGHFQDDEDAHHAPLLSPLSMQILGALADECQLEPGLEGPTFRLVKRHRAG